MLMVPMMMVQAMQPDDEAALKSLVLRSAQLSLKMSGISVDSNQLESIKESDLIDVVKEETENSESYIATLTNGDYLLADYFHSGPRKGNISCTRMISSMDGNSDIPMKSTYFYMLKKIVEQKNK